MEETSSTLSSNFAKGRSLASEPATTQQGKSDVGFLTFTMHKSNWEKALIWDSSNFQIHCKVMSLAIHFSLQVIQIALHVFEVVWKSVVQMLDHVQHHSCGNSLPWSWPSRKVIILESSLESLNQILMAKYVLLFFEGCTQQKWCNPQPHSFETFATLFQ